MTINPSPSRRERPAEKPWTFLTNHARVLILIARAPTSRLRDLADAIGITERAVQEIVGDLEEAGYLTRSRVGRRNRYALSPDQPLRHPVEADHQVRDLIGVFTQADQGDRPYRPTSFSPSVRAR